VNANQVDFTIDLTLHMICINWP